MRLQAYCRAEEVPASGPLDRSGPSWRHAELLRTNSAIRSRASLGRASESMHPAPSLAICCPKRTKGTLRVASRSQMAFLSSMPIEASMTAAEICDDFACISALAGRYEVNRRAPDSANVSWRSSAVGTSFCTMRIAKPLRSGSVISLSPLGWRPVNVTASELFRGKPAPGCRCRQNTRRSGCRRRRAPLGGRSR